jgi:hypothetical protein
MIWHISAATEPSRFRDDVGFRYAADHQVEGSGKQLLADRVKPQTVETDEAHLVAGAANAASPAPRPGH